MMARATRPYHLWIAGIALLSLTAIAGQAQNPARVLPPGADVEAVGPRTTAVDFAAYAEVRHVSAKGADTGDGRAARPWRTLAHALAEVKDASPSKRYAVLVAAGTYPLKSLRLKAHVDLYGGMSGDWKSRDLLRHRTILDGQKQERLLIGADPVRVDGFTLRGGRARGHGGAVLCERTSPVFTNNTFEDNATLVPPGYLRGIFHQIGAEGGAIACTLYASPRIENNLFVNNWTEIGGGAAIGMRTDSVRPKEEIPGPNIRGNVFIGSRSGVADIDPDVKKRYRSSNGGAISLSNYYAEIENNLFIDNRAGGNGDGGGIYCEYEASPRIAHNHFVGNRAEDDGGSIYSMKLSEPIIERNVFTGSVGGGSIRLSKHGRGIIKGNLIFANPGGGIYAGDSWAAIEENTIADNPGSGVGLRIQVAAYIRPSVVKRNIVRGNAGTQILLEDTEAVVEDNNVQGGFAGASNQDTAVTLDSAPRNLTISAIDFDPARGISSLTLGAAVPGISAGRVIRLGERSCVVGSWTANRVQVWGDARGGGMEAVLLGSYLPTR
jgi:predicted outer membrane repeat protein